MTTQPQTPPPALPGVLTGTRPPLSGHLAWLEAEAMYVIREVAAQFERPALLFSGGKDSIIMLHMARKAFHPAGLPFPIVHIDTGHNFPEVIAYRDELVAALGERLIVGSVEEAIRAGLAHENPGQQSRNRAQSPALLETIRRHRLDALMGGARRDEEKARAKERMFSFRNELGQWEPRDQRPELWNLYNGRIHRGMVTDGPGFEVGEHIRAFPLSNWTELDVWEYIEHEGIVVPSIYFSHEREIVVRAGSICPVSSFFPARAGEKMERRMVRFRTVGDMTCTAGVDTPASSPRDVIRQIIATRQSERGARLDDTFSEAAMEDRKREGYF
ncbi:MAG: sulfate adenylyltransferase subunit CysD [Tepidisphaera sp.]|nr:sulfate adenylyltransferase subunit CysD [Tepidisphaera sp.]